MLAIRVKGNPVNFTTALRTAVQSLNPAQPISAIEPMQDLVDAQLGPRRVLMLVLAFFAMVALALALVGVYGVISYSVTQRTRELGIRRALGAPESSIVQMIIAQTLRLTFGGIIIGTATAMAVTRFIESYLFNISAKDPVTFVGVSVLFTAVAVAAAFAPAFRAANIDPMRVLRQD
jgi:ABC-type antimicrobial peptide transport system permease subunit